MLFFAVLSGFFLAGLAPIIVRRLGHRAGWLLAVLPAGLTIYFLTLLVGQEPGEGLRVTYAWASNLGVQFSLRADGLSLLFAVLISGIGTLIYIYAGGYFGKKKSTTLFYTWLSVFMAAMLGVVLADNLFMLYVFWELTSLSSFMLIGMEHEREAARGAALQALLVTGAGGLAMLGGLTLLGFAGGSFEISTLLTQRETILAGPYWLPVLILLLAGAFTKSAQFPFHFWLPGAMEAPTPVSAYLHSATMVKAGIYLLARFHILFVGTPVWEYTLLIVGAATMLVGAYLALNHTDLKRILAYSTVSALGTMVVLLSLDASGAVKAAMVYLLAHALYKGALFLIAGIIDHAAGTRNVDELGGLRRAMPITFFITAAAAVSLAGILPALGFVGKELLFETFLEAHSYGLILVGIAVVTGLVNVAVALIITIRPFLGSFRAPTEHLHLPEFSLWIGPGVLAALGLLLGLFPAASADIMITSAVTSILHRQYDVVLALWHGINTALILSLVSIFLGSLAYLAWRFWRRVTSPLERILRFGPQAGYLLFLQAVNGYARFQVGLLQTGYLRHYIIIILTTALGLVSYAFLRWGGLHLPQEWVLPNFYEVAIAIIILGAAIVAVRSYSRLAAVAALGITGYGVALIFLLFGAPDLAMTQFLIESLTVILFVFAFYHLPHFSRFTPTRVKVAQALFSILVGAMMSALVLSATGLNMFPSISSYFLENAVSLAHGRDIVNVILVDFRSIDTLGEITVLAIAGVGVYALLKLQKGGKVLRGAEPKGEDHPYQIGAAVTGDQETQTEVTK
jgi:multicomponent Na+:H+ antiporter subunit A